jgi:hypothetical protein
MKLLPCLLSLLLLSATASAASPTQPQAPDTERTTEAGLLLDMLGMDRTMNVTVDLMLDAQLASKPELVPYRRIMADFFARHMSYASIRDDLVAIYASEFTAEELRVTREYYSTPAGQKFLERMPRLVQLGAELGTRKVTENLPELEEMIVAERKRLASLEAMGELVEDDADKAGKRKNAANKDTD